MASEQKIKLFKKLIESAPENSILAANGLNYKHLSSESFQALYPAINEAREDLLYYLVLNSKNKSLFLSIFEKETENILADYVHFDIKLKDKVIARSYGQMKWVEILPNYFPSINAAKKILFDQVDIVPSSKII